MSACCVFKFSSTRKLLLNGYGFCQPVANIVADVFIVHFASIDDSAKFYLRILTRMLFSSPRVEQPTLVPLRCKDEHDVRTQAHNYDQ